MLTKLLLIASFLLLLVLLVHQEQYLVWSAADFDHLVGTEVVLHTDMKLVELNGAHSDFGLTEEEILIGIFLTVAGSARNLEVEKLSNSSHELPKGSTLKVVGVYERKSNWFMQSFNQDRPYLVVTTDEGVKAMLSTMDLPSVK